MTIHSHLLELGEVGLGAVFVEVLLEAPNLRAGHAQRLQILVGHELDLTNILHLRE